MNFINAGKDFENQWRNSMPDDVYYQRIKDPAQSFSHNEGLRFSSENPYDCFIFSYPYMFTLELKSTEGTSMTFYRDDFATDGSKNTFMVKKNQIRGLSESGTHVGVVSGFILNFRKYSRTYFLGIDEFNNMARFLNKKSFNESDVVEAGAYLISQTLKRTKYSYDVAGFISDIKNKKNKEIKLDA